jgi:hypothetical protein
MSADLTNNSGVHGTNLRAHTYHHHTTVTIITIITTSITTIVVTLIAITMIIVINDNNIQRPTRVDVFPRWWFCRGEIGTRYMVHGFGYMGGAAESPR